MRKLADFSVFDSSPRTEDFRGSYSPGCLVDPVSDLTRRIDKIHRGGGNEIEKLLH